MAEAPRIVFAGGGTGGHLYPGLAVAAELRAMAPEAEITFVVTRRAIDRRVLAEYPWTVRYEDARGMSSRPWRWPAVLARLWANERRARVYLRELRPHAVVGLGGFGSYAPARAAQKVGIATFVLNPDLVVGRANRRLSREAEVVFCQFDETVTGLRCRGRVEVVGCPVRGDLFGVDRTEACRVLGLDPDKKTLAVTGASSGARSVNQAVVALCRRWQQFPDWQVLHLTGRDLFAEVRSAVGDDVAHLHLRDYVEEMGLVYAAADLVVARSGAGTVAELTALGLPSVLMPYPYHRDRHQERHARKLEEAGAAVMVLDQVKPRANADALWQALAGLMEDAARREAMAEAARSLGRPNAAQSVARVLVAAGGQSPQDAAEPMETRSS